MSSHVRSSISLFQFFLNVLSTLQELQPTDPGRGTNTRNICSQPGIKKLMGPFPTYESRQLILDESRKLAFCFVPKVACTNFKRIFLGLAGIVKPAEVYNLSGYAVHKKHIDDLKLLKDFNIEERDNITAQYKKFMFVRDPLERLLSAYRNKFETHPNKARRANFFELVKQVYIEHPMRRKERNIIAKLENKTLPFQDFLYFILDHLELKGQVDEHFMPTTTLCNPCKIKYDYIGHYEHLNDEADKIFRDLSIDYKFPARNDNYSSDETEDLVKSYYSVLPRELILSIWEVFKQDYIIFNLPIPGWLMKFNPLNSGTVLLKQHVQTK